MREILFRGKRKNDGKWVEGSYAYISGCHWIVDRDATWQYGELEEVNEIDPETLGQFTGIADKTGKKMFDGDILRCTPRIGFGHEYVVTLHDIFMTARLNPYNNIFEVIGNIHDNPELLERR